MHTVVETPTYLAAAKKAGVSDAERDIIIAHVAANPEDGDIIEGGGGVRKVRIARENAGKRGSYRVVTYYMTDDQPVFLITMLSKGKAENLAAEQKKAAKFAAKDIKKGK